MGIGPQVEFRRWASTTKDRFLLMHSFELHNYFQERVDTFNGKPLFSEGAAHPTDIMVARRQRLNAVEKRLCVLLDENPGARIFITADHAEGFSPNHCLGHGSGHNPSAELLHIPLIEFGPHLKKIKIDTRLVPQHRLRQLLTTGNVDQSPVTVRWPWGRRGERSEMAIFHLCDTGIAVEWSAGGKMKSKWWEADTRRYIRRNHPNATAMGGVMQQNKDVVSPAWRTYLDAAFSDARPDGFLMEFGVHKGRSIRWLSERAPAGGLVHGFDSFRGLPEDWEDQNSGGTVRAGQFNLDGKPPEVPENVKLHVGLFEESVDAFLLNHPGPVRFAHIDCDLYSSTMDVLTALGDANRIVSGTVLAFDEFWNFSAWRKHEWLAFTECAERYGWRWHVTRYLKHGYQAAVRIEEVVPRAVVIDEERGMATEDRIRLLKEEIAIWSEDQFKGDAQVRRKAHQDRWERLHRDLKMERGSLKLPPGPICVVGCGHGWVELEVAEDYQDRTVIATDLFIPDREPPEWGAVKIGSADRVRYCPGIDAQRHLPFVQPPGYALIVAVSVLHHFPDLEAAADTFLRSLAPGGLVLVQEYAGGNRLCADERRYRVAERIWQALPKSYRLRDDGTEQERIFKPDPDRVGCGFESIRSQDVRPVFSGAFEVVAEHSARPISGYRAIVWGEHGTRRLDPGVDRMLDAFEAIMMEEGWLSGEDWTALLRKPGAGD